jgi:hypothetical protein
MEHPLRAVRLDQDCRPNTYQGKPSRYFNNEPLEPRPEWAEAFAEAFGFTVALRTAEELHLRGTAAGSPCVLIRKSARTKCLGAAFLAADGGDVMRLAETTGRRVDRLPDTVGGIGVTLTDPTSWSRTVHDRISIEQTVVGQSRALGDVFDPPKFSTRH